ncbi:GreA/GreB family elongation factor [Streptomyces sp. SID8352]|uniref:GreA/GreB family elongation factor n=1 Tax=Streptomyces sp. SID8352 TaxID=2690338 RepID=UPI0013707F91|nr:GreA/GreB family elongation factor [Streptomyces sp. SID8352]MYU25071.1 nucleoside diphosphate kinase regulator [Streptomyces sp. SID8352]
MSGEPEPISAEARRAVRRDRDDLRTERDAVAATLGDADAPGDEADRADELRRADRLRRIDDRLDELTERLRRADTAGPPREDVIAVGTTVRVRFGDGTERTLSIGETATPEDLDVVTADSPLGLALLGHRAGARVDYRTPGGPDTATVVSLG